MDESKIRCSVGITAYNEEAYIVCLLNFAGAVHLKADS